MKVITYAAADEKTSPQFCQAFSTGARCDVQVGGPLREGAVAMFGSPKLFPLLREAQDKGRPWFYGDHAYFGRNKYFRITRDDYQYTGSTPTIPMDRARARFASFGRPVQPWTRSGGHVLLCPQSAAYFAHFGLDVEAWIEDRTAMLRSVTDREIRLRWKGDSATRPIAEDLRDCWAVVTYSSASALDALIAGVPVFVDADFCCAYRFGLPDPQLIESPIYPDGREDLMAVLATHQWTFAEMRRGDAWRAMSGSGW